MRRAINIFGVLFKALPRLRTAHARQIGPHNSFRASTAAACLPVSPLLSLSHYAVIKTIYHSYLSAICYHGRLLFFGKPSSTAASHGEGLAPTTEGGQEVLCLPLPNPSREGGVKLRFSVSWLCGGWIVRARLPPSFGGVLA